MALLPQYQDFYRKVKLAFNKLEKAGFLIRRENVRRNYLLNENYRQPLL